MDNKEDIDKLDKQINNLLQKEIAKSEKEEELDQVKEVINDSTSAYDEVDGDTKKIDDITNINEEKKETRIDRLEEKEKELEELANKKTRVERLEEEEEELKESEEKEKKSKMSKKKKIIITCSIIGVLLIVALVTYLVISHNKKIENEKKDTLSKSEQQEIIEDYGDALKGVIAVYYEKQKVLLEYKDAVKLVDFDYDVKCSEHEIYEDGEIYLNKCMIDTKKTTYSYGKKQKEVKPEETDDKIKVYVNKETKKATLDEPKDKDKYDIYGFNIEGEFSELKLLGEYGSDYVYYTDKEYAVHMLNFKTGVKALNPLNYTNILPIESRNSFDLEYVAVEINNMWGIYNLNTRERVVNHNYKMLSPILSMGVSGHQSSISTLDHDSIAVWDGEYYGVINYKTGEEIIPLKYKTMLLSGNYLWVEEDNEAYHILDFSNNEYLKDKYAKVYGIVSGKYILVKDKNDIKMIKIDGTELYNYGKKELGKLNYFLEYNGALFSFHKDNRSNDCIEVTYDPSTKNGEIKDMICGGVAKPVLYLYPEKTTKVEVSFEHPEYLETTYPKYNGKWEVVAKKNGDLKDKNNKYYYALYWDEKKIHSVDFNTGYYVTKDKAIDFLESKLTYIGLSDKEMNEFIMYWLPILEKNGKSLVYFELTEERESYNKINIEPTPDSLLRLVIHIKKVDKKVDIPKQKLTKFKRFGFTAVEWGGTTY